MGLKERARAKKRKAAVATKMKRRGPAGADRQAAQASKPQVLPFEAAHRALLVGEGDFSFSCAMGQLLPGAVLGGVVTTTLDSEAQTRKKYPRSKRYTEQLQRRGVTVRFGVDATAPSALAACGAAFERVVFQFPHSGQQRVHVNRALLRDFFEAATTVLAPGGQVVVTLKDRRPYSGWLLEEQAAQAGFRLVRSVPFDPKKFPGYRHVTTEAEAAVDGTHGFEVIFAKTSFFALAAGSAAAPAATAAAPAAAPVAAEAEVESDEDSEDADDESEESDSDDEASDEEEALRRKIIAMGGEDPRVLLQREQEAQAKEARQKKEAPGGSASSSLVEDKIVFSDSEGSELDGDGDSLSSGDESFVTQMIKKKQQQQQQQQTASSGSGSSKAQVVEADKIVFSDTDGSDLDMVAEGDDEDGLSSEDESFIAKMQRIHRSTSTSSSTGTRQNSPASAAGTTGVGGAGMSEEERHDAMLEAARQAARARREAAAAPAAARAPAPAPVQAAAATQASSSTNAMLTTIEQPNAVQAAATTAAGTATSEHSKRMASSLGVGSRVRCLYPSDGGRYAATILFMDKDKDDATATVTVKWDDGDTQHTERPMKEVWPLTESESESEAEVGAEAVAEDVRAVDARAYIQSGRVVPQKEKSALLRKLRKAGRAALVGSTTKQKNTKKTAAAAATRGAAGSTWPVPGQALRLSSASGSASSKRKAAGAAGSGGGGASGETTRAKKRRKTSKKKRQFTSSVVVTEEESQH
eukprot:COSAG06_NODE_727_length_12752_cov_61.232277_9_plen_754_part_00